jgi:hypothetical protein
MQDPWTTGTRRTAIQGGNQILIRTDVRSGSDSGRPIGHQQLVGALHQPAAEPASLENRTQPTSDRHAKHQELQDAYFDAVREYQRGIQTVAQMKLKVQSARNALDVFRESETPGVDGR